MSGTFGRSSKTRENRGFLEQLELTLIRGRQQSSESLVVRVSGKLFRNRFNLELDDLEILLHRQQRKYLPSLGNEADAEPGAHMAACDKTHAGRQLEHHDHDGDEKRSPQSSR